MWVSWQAEEWALLVDEGIIKQKPPANLPEVFVL